MILESLNPTVFALVAIALYTLVLVLTRKRKLKFWQNALLFLAPIVALVAFAVVRYLVLESRLDPFQPHLAEYTAAAERGTGEVYRRGKIIPVDRRKDTVDYTFYYQLPRELRAANPEEVGTVVWLDCTASLVGTYTHGGGAYRWYCDVTLVDLPQSLILEEKTFVGSEPPTTNSGSSNKEGSFPSAEIIAYLEALPSQGE